MVQSRRCARNRRRRLIAAQLCGWCMAPRGAFAWLCDACCKAHRERQRLATVAKREAREAKRDALLKYLLQRRSA